MANSRLGRFSRFNVVLITKPMAVLSADLTDKTVTLIRVPDDLYITELAFGYGPYRSAAIYSVGQLDKRGGETVMATMSDYLGIPVDGYIKTDSMPTDIKRFVFNPQLLFKGESSLNIVDRLQLGVLLLQTRFDKIKLVDLGTLAGPLVLADGSMALSLDKEILDNNLRDFFVEKKVRDENLRVEVVNSTIVLGLGNRAGRVLSNMGANVINVGSTDQPLSSCQIQTTGKIRNSQTVARIVQIFSCQVTDLAESGRADVVVILDQDYAKRLGK